ncbi:MAG: TonB-dependent receptor [Spongiibacteraceae bacterium]
MKTIFNSKLIVNAISLATAMSCAGLVSAAAADKKLEEVIITSQFREVSVMSLAGSASVFGQHDIQARSASNLDQLLNMAPNVNFSSGASRGRFVQIRGIGERSQFTDPVNPSVGLIIDGVDFTGLGLAANTLDIAQVEVLRGPQGTLYGANALAGLIYLNSNKPTDTFEAKVSAELAEYDSYKFSGVVSGPINEKLKYRVAAQNQQSDGYIKNNYLNRDDVNNIDESIIKATLQMDASESLQVSLSALYIDTDNGYDAFSLYNTRKTLSDNPGWDRQETVASALSVSWTGANFFDVESVVSFARSDTEYGFDEDWTYEGFHPDGFNSTDNYERERDNISLDLRFVSKQGNNIFNGSTSWVAGIYARTEDEDLVRTKYKNSIRQPSFKSRFETENYAVYGELRTELNEQLALIVGARAEQRDASYSDNLNVNLANDEDLWGGHITVEYQLQDDILLYALVSRGYKAGGVNGSIISVSASNSQVSADMFAFDTESMLNYEVGLKGDWLDQRLQLQVSAFYQDRDDVQAKQSIYNPTEFSFDDFLTNAASASSMGVELDVTYQVASYLRLFASAGWLDAEFDDFKSVTHVDYALTDTPVDLGGRDLAHAPNYQYFIGSEISLSNNLLFRVEVEGKDAFYFSNSHDEKSASYSLVNARLTYEQADWSVSIWGKNLTDKDYYTRGFYFSHFYGNNPANGYAPEGYYQYGDPRVLGVSGTYNF